MHLDYGGCKSPSLTTGLSGIRTVAPRMGSQRLIHYASPPPLSLFVIVWALCCCPPKNSRGTGLRGVRFKSTSLAPTSATDHREPPARPSSSSSAIPSKRSLDFLSRRRPRTRYPAHRTNYRVVQKSWFQVARKVQPIYSQPRPAMPGCCLTKQSLFMHNPVVSLPATSSGHASKPGPHLNNLHVTSRIAYHARCQLKMCVLHQDLGYLESSAPLIDYRIFMSDHYF